MVEDVSLRLPLSLSLSNLTFKISSIQFSLSLSLSLTLTHTHTAKFRSDLVHIHLMDQIMLHPGDAMQAGNWEIYAAFFLRYPYLADAKTLSVCNHWRASRGESPLTPEGLWEAHDRLYPEDR